MNVSNNNNKRPREEEGNGQDSSSMSWRALYKKMSFERMRLLEEVLVKRDQLEIAYTKRVVEELKRFLILKTMKRDLDATKLSPSQRVDHAWHALLELPQV